MIWGARRRPFLLLASLLGLMLLVAGGCAAPAAPTPTTAPPTPTTAPPTAAAAAGGTPSAQATITAPLELPSKGPKDAKVTIIEFSDFQ